METGKPDPIKNKLIIRKLNSEDPSFHGDPQLKKTRPKEKLDAARDAFYKRMLEDYPELNTPEAEAELREINQISTSGKRVPIIEKDQR